MIWSDGGGSSLPAPNPNPPNVKIYTMQKLADATQDFSDHNRIGSGPHGDVYKGTLDGQTVVIKRLGPTT